MNEFTTTLPGDCDAMRRRLYEGEIFLLPANECTKALVESTLSAVVETLGTDYRKAHADYDSVEFFKRIGRLRKQIYTGPDFHALVNKVIDSFGFDLSQQAYDPARLRVVSHEGHLNPAAAPIYYGHRDTWYSNPQGMLTWWIPLHDVIADETFEFFPQEFSRPVKNDSEIFDFDEWVSKGLAKRIGWQKKDTGRTAGYPSLQETPQGPRLPVVAGAGDLLLFSGQHLHQTRENMTDYTRFSLDFRTINLIDQSNGVEAVNVDNRSKGSSAVQFVYPNGSELA